MKIHSGDTIKILIGKDKGRTGQVVRVMPKSRKLIVKGINLVKKHLKSNQGQTGGIIDKEAPLYASKVILVCPHCKKTTRVGYLKDSKTGEKIRVCKKCSKPIDTAPKAAKTKDNKSVKTKPAKKVTKK